MNLSELLNAAGEIGMYSIDPQWKARLDQQRQQKAESEARVGMMKAQSEAVMPKVQAQERRNLASVINSLKSGEYGPEQIAAITSQLQPEERDIVGAALAGHVPTAKAKREGTEAKTFKTTAETDLVREKTKQLPKKTAAEIAALGRRGSTRNKGKSPAEMTLAQIEKEIYRVRNNKAMSGERVLSDQNALNENADDYLQKLEKRRAELQSLPGLVPPPSAPAPPATPSAKPTGQLVNFGGVTVQGDADARQKAVQLQRMYVALPAEKKASFLRALRVAGVSDPEGLVGPGVSRR